MKTVGCRRLKSLNRPVFRHSVEAQNDVKDICSGVLYFYIVVCVCGGEVGRERRRARETGAVSLGSCLDHGLLMGQLAGPARECVELNVGAHLLA